MASRTKNNYFPAAIHTLYQIDVDSDVSYRELLFEIAAHNPSAVSGAYAALREEEAAVRYAGESPAEFIQRVRDHLRAGEKIQAIKAWREVTCDGLKESKHIIDDMQDRILGFSENRMVNKHNWGTD